MTAWPTSHDCQSFKNPLKMPTSIGIFLTGGDWVCDLADPYDRAVAWELVELAWEEDGEVTA